jgi:TolB-like protein
MNRLLITVILALAVLWAFPAFAALSYEESLKQLAEGVIADAVKAKRGRLALVDFTDAKGTVTPIGKFLAEELGTQILVAGEIKVIDHTVVGSTLKKLQVTQFEPGQVKAVAQAAKAVHADVFATGSYQESPDGLRVTIKLLNPSTVQSLGATRGTLPKTGPLAELIKEVNKPPVVKVDLSAKPAPPPGLGFQSNETYQLVVTALHKRNTQVTADLTIENKSPSTIKALCLLQDTVLEDDQGMQWTLAVENNREGLCMRGIELSPRAKVMTALTFSAPTDAHESQLILHYHEKAPRRDARFSIKGLNIEPTGTPPATTDAISPPSN